MNMEIEYIKPSDKYIMNTVHTPTEDNATISLCEQDFIVIKLNILFDLMCNCIMFMHVNFVIL